MDKDKIYSLLSEGRVDDALDTLLESLEGPSLDNEDKELENEATEDKTEPEAKDLDNKDLFPADEHDEAEEVKEVIVEEVDNETTLDKKPEEMQPELNNDDLYDSEGHEEDKDISEEQLFEKLIYVAYNDEILEENNLEYIIENFLSDEECGYILEELETEEFLNESFLDDLKRKAEDENMEAKHNREKLSTFFKGVGKRLEDRDAVDTYIKSLESKHSNQAAEMKNTRRTAREELINAGIDKIKNKIKNKFTFNKEKKERINRINKELDEKIKSANTKIDENSIKKVREFNKNSKLERENTKKNLLKQSKDNLNNEKQEMLRKQKEEKDSKIKERIAADEAKLEKLGLKKASEQQTPQAEVNPAKKDTAKEQANLKEMMSWLDNNGYETSYENLSILKEAIKEGELMVEDILDSNPEVTSAEASGVASEKYADTAVVEPSVESDVNIDIEETKEELDKILDVTPSEESLVKEPSSDDLELSESMRRIFDLLDTINESAQVAAGPELKAGKELENEATEDKAEPEAKDLDNKDLFPTDEHKEVEEVKEVIVEEADKEATLDRKPEEMEPELDNKDLFPADEHKEVEEVKEVIVESKPINHKSDDTGLSHIETKYEYYNDKDAEDGEKRRVVVTKKSVDHVDGSEEILSKEDRVNKGKSGRNYGSLKENVDNVATEEKTPETMEQDLNNKELFPTDEHKEVEDVVEVVVEAAKLCSENGVPATLANITKYAKTLFESEAVALNVGKPEDKEYDADADIESAEMNGNKEEFECYEKIQGEGAEAAKAEESVVEPKDLHETVKYTSLREACSLNEDYFANDSYTVQTAEEKQTKLTEQISLLLAREAMDPLYEELLQASIKAQRLQEACISKYRPFANQKANMIMRSPR